VAASVRIEDEAFTDMRVDALGVLLGTSKFDALGRLAHLWRQATQMGQDVLPSVLVAQVVDPDKLVESGLGEKKKTGVRLKGAKGRIEWLEMKRRVGRENGIKGREFGRLGGRPTKTPTKPGEGVSENPPPAPAPAPLLPSEEGSAPAPKRPKAPRPRDEMFDAIAEVTGSNPHAVGGRIAKVKQALVDRPDPFTPDDVREFARRYRDLCPHARDAKTGHVALGDLAGYIDRLRSRPAKSDAEADALRRQAQRVLDERSQA
jgi:hypothetical protein